MDFSAKWITGPAAVDRDSEVAPYFFRKQVTLPENVEHAMIYATALGIYSIFWIRKKSLIPTLLRGIRSTITGCNIRNTMCLLF